VNFERQSMTKGLIAQHNLTDDEDEKIVEVFVPRQKIEP